MQIIYVIAFALYFCALTGIGLWFYRKAQQSSEFMLGNRQVNYWVTAIATQASDMGGWLFLGFPAVVYANGLFEFWTAIGLVTFMFLNWQLIAPRLRAQTEQTQSLTLSTFFAHRFNDSTGTIQLVSALVSLLFFVFYIASGLVALGRLFESAFGFDYHTGLIAGLLSAAVYTLIGGFLAVAWCDFFQGIFLLIVIALVPFLAYCSIDGWTTITHAAQAGGVSLSLIPEGKNVFHALLLAAGWGLGYFGQPHILINFMGIDTVKNIRFAKYIGITWQIIVLSCATAIGLVGLGYFGADALPGELIFITMTKQLFPPMIAGFALCAILAAALSTMDSLLFLSGSVIAEDVYKNIINRNASPKSIVWIARACTIGASCLSLFVAWNNSTTVYDLVYFAWSGLGSAFGPVVIAALYLKSINKYGALSGILAGGLTAALWPYINIALLPTFIIPALIPGYIMNFTALYGVTSLTRKLNV